VKIKKFKNLTLFEIIKMTEKQSNSKKNKISDLEKFLSKYSLTEKELDNVLKNANRPISENNPVYIPKTKIKYGVISDTHIGSIYYDANLMTRAAKEFNKRKLDFVIHVGDVCEGHYEGHRQGSVFELSHIGGDNQIKYAAEELNKIDRKTPLYFITGNHENNTFFKLTGFEIGKTLEQMIKNSKFLGNAEGEIILPYEQKMMLLHPDGGSSYAISYRSQKIAESLEGGKKPAILHIGHYHKSEYLHYRNIHIIQSATLESQTKFMKGHHISAHKGFWIIEADVSKEGVKRFKPEYFNEY
jgi:predicted phosphodiesterase